MWSVNEILKILCTGVSWVCVSAGGLWTGLWPLYDMTECAAHSKYHWFEARRKLLCINLLFFQQYIIELREKRQTPYNIIITNLIDLMNRRICWKGIRIRTAADGWLAAVVRRGLFWNQWISWSEWDQPDEFGAKKRRAILRIYTIFNVLEIYYNYN